MTMSDSTSQGDNESRSCGVCSQPDLELIHKVPNKFIIRTHTVDKAYSNTRIITGLVRVIAVPQ